MRLAGGDNTHWGPHERAMLIDIVLTTFKRPRWTGEAIESVLRQTYANWRLIVVDDASPDGTADDVDKYARHDPRITLVRLEENLGPTGAKSVGIARGSGDVIAFLDSDDRWHERKLELQIARLKEKPGLRAVHTNVCHIDSDGIVIPGSADGENALRNTIPYDSLGPEELAEELMSKWSIRIVSAIVLRDAFEDAGGFDDTLSTAAEYDFWVRLAATGHAVGHLAIPAVDRRLHEGQVTRTERLVLQETRLYAVDRLIADYPWLTRAGKVRKASLLQEKAVWSISTGDGRSARAAMKQLVALNGLSAKLGVGWALSYFGPLQRPLFGLYAHFGQRLVR